jgi:pimeloyl-ACP methyl ester carboxylesterase
MQTKRITLRRVAVAVVVLVVVAYGGAIAWLIANETRLVFRAPAAMGDLRPSTPYAQIDEKSLGSAAVPARAWLIPAATADPAPPWLIFLHGNDATIASRLNVIHYERLRALGLNIVAPEYRGFAGLDGVPSESGLTDDAVRWYQYLRDQKHVPEARIIIYGWSLGSAVAVNLASQVSEAAVILEGAPASVVAIGQQQYPYFPIRLLIRNPFESIVKVQRIHAPMLFLHSREDVVIPFSEGRRLFEAAAPPKQFVEVRGGHIYASEKDPAFFPAVQAFLRAQHLLP